MMPNPPPMMTFDELSLERSNSFLMALQELKNLRPQLYSAAEYCEKSYVHGDQEQMVMENLKDYAVKALVNAIDHLGTVASKLNDLFQLQTLDLATVEMKISSLFQQVLTCQRYMDKEGFRQQQGLTSHRRYHKRYILPSRSKKYSVSKVPNSPRQRPMYAGQTHIQAGLQTNPSVPTPLSWHLPYQTTSPLNVLPHTLAGAKHCNASGSTTQLFSPLDAEMASSTPVLAHLRSTSTSPGPGALLLNRMDSSQATIALSPFRSFNTQRRHGLSRLPLRSKSMLSFFIKTKSTK